MDPKILIFGKGFIGTRIKEELRCALSERKIYSFADVQEEIEKFKPKVIINCIGHTGKNNVDDCELDKDKSLIANTFAPIILAEAALRNNLRFVHISSGCIYHFDSSCDKPISEEEIPDYFDLFYSRTKIYAEGALGALVKEFPILIIRIRVPLDNRPNPRNILTKLIKYKKVIDLPNSITYIPDFILALKHLLNIKAKGIYNVVNKGGLRYPRLMKIYKKYVPDFEYKVIDFKELRLNRTNLIMSTKKLEQSGFRVRKIDDVLDECVRGYVRIMERRDFIF
jgi:3,5-epimerase/4-reductase